MLMARKSEPAIFFCTWCNYWVQCTVFICYSVCVCVCADIVWKGGRQAGASHSEWSYLYPCTHMHARIYTHMHARIHTHIHTHTHTYTHSHTTVKELLQCSPLLVNYHNAVVLRTKLPPQPHNAIAASPKWFAVNIYEWHCSVCKPKDLGRNCGSKGSFIIIIII